jgi:hypothetical protein
MFQNNKLLCFKKIKRNTQWRARGNFLYKGLVKSTKPFFSGLYGKCIVWV